MVFLGRPPKIGSVIEVHNFPNFQHCNHYAITMNHHQDPERVQSCLSDTKQRKQVSFDRLTIREYPIIVGDNPSVKAGPPLTISWEHVYSVDIDVDMYERARDLSFRREQSDMKLPREQRQKLLKNLGFTMSDMQKGSKAAAKRRNQRRQSNAQMNKDSLHESLEDLRRGLAHAVTLGMTRRKEKQFLRTHVPSFDSSQ